MHLNLQLSSTCISEKPISLWISLCQVVLTIGTTDYWVSRSLKCRLYNYNDKDKALNINIQTESQISAIFDIIYWIIFIIYMFCYICYILFLTRLVMLYICYLLSAMSSHGYRPVSGRLLVFIKTPSQVTPWKMIILDMTQHPQIQMYIQCSCNPRTRTDKVLTMTDLNFYYPSWYFQNLRPPAYQTFISEVNWRTEFDKATLTGHWTPTLSSDWRCLAVSLLYVLYSIMCLSHSLSLSLIHYFITFIF